MFDKSFNRSRDYFVALQLLRIMDEWINEAVSSMQQLRDDTHFMHPGFSTFEIKDNLDAVDRYMKEQAGTVQRRLQKKKEEINSLRDGVRISLSVIYGNVANTESCSCSTQHLFASPLKQWR